MTFDEIKERMRQNGAILRGETERAICIEWRNNTLFIPRPAKGDHYTDAELDQIRDIILQETDYEFTVTFNGDVTHH
ncbi:MAG: hypothetical protein ACPH8B_06465 [Candidatus Puniceispirillum sp.]